MRGSFKRAMEHESNVESMNSEQWDIFNDSLAVPPSRRVVRGWDRARVSAHAPRLQGQKVWKKPNARVSKVSENVDFNEEELEKEGEGARKRLRAVGAKENIGFAGWKTSEEATTDFMHNVGNLKPRGILTPNKRLLNVDISNTSGQIASPGLQKHTYPVQQFIPRKRTNKDNVISPKKPLRQTTLNRQGKTQSLAAMPAADLAKIPVKISRPRRSLRQSGRMSILLNMDEEMKDSAESPATSDVQLFQAGGSQPVTIPQVDICTVYLSPQKLRRSLRMGGSPVKVTSSIVPRTPGRSPKKNVLPNTYEVDELLSSPTPEAQIANTRTPTRSPTKKNVPDVRNLDEMLGSPSLDPPTLEIGKTVEEEELENKHGDNGPMLDTQDGDEHMRDVSGDPVTRPSTSETIQRESLISGEVLLESEFEVTETTTAALDFESSDLYLPTAVVDKESGPLCLPELSIDDENDLSGELCDFSRPEKILSSDPSEYSDFEMAVHNQLISQLSNGQSTEMDLNTVIEEGEERMDEEADIGSPKTDVKSIDVTTCSRTATEVEDAPDFDAILQPKSDDRKPAVVENIISTASIPLAYDQDDTDMLKNFLSRVEANKAAKKSPRRKRSLPHSPLQIPLGDTVAATSISPTQDKGSSLEKTNGKSLDTVSQHDQSPGIRRSSRTRLPVKAAPSLGVPSFIPVRRLGGNGEIDSTLTLTLSGRNEEKELVALTRVNTRKNKGSALLPPVVLAKKADDKEDPVLRQRLLKEVFDERAKKSGKKGKGLNVQWAEELAQYQEIAKRGAAAKKPVTKVKIGKAEVVEELQKLEDIVWDEPHAEEKPREQEKGGENGKEKVKEIPKPKVKVNMKSRIALGMGVNGTPAPKRRGQRNIR